MLWGSPTDLRRYLEELAESEAAVVCYSGDIVVLAVGAWLLHERRTCLCALKPVVADDLLGALVDLLAHLRKLKWGFRSNGRELIAAQRPPAPGTGRLVKTSLLVHPLRGISVRLLGHS